MGFENGNTNSVHLLLESLAGKPYNGNESVWDKFMSDTVQLELCYLKGVKKAIDNGRWRGKNEPIAFIRKVGQTAALNLYGVKDAEDRALADVGRVCRRALDPEQRFHAKNTREYELRYDCPRRQARANAGPVSGLRFTSGTKYADVYSNQSTYEDKLEPLAFISLKNESANLSRVPERLLIDPNYESKGESPRVNWEKVATEAKLDIAERVVTVMYWSRGISRDQALAQQPTDAKRKSIQAAWKRMDRNDRWDTIKRILRGVSNSRQTTRETLATQNGAFRPPSDVLREVARKARLTSGAAPTGPARYDYTGLVSW